MLLGPVAHSQDQIDSGSWPRPLQLVLGMLEIAIAHRGLVENWCHCFHSVHHISNLIFISYSNEVFQCISLVVMYYIANSMLEYNKNAIQCPKSEREGELLNKNVKFPLF